MDKRCFAFFTRSQLPVEVAYVYVCVSVFQPLRGRKRTNNEMVAGHCGHWRHDEEKTDDVTVKKHKK